MNKTVVVAMSGGVDSSVAALLLMEQGYNCIGVTMKLWDYQTVGGNLNHDSGCCSLDSINDARMVCGKLGIPHYVLNFSREFESAVVNNFVNEYIEGRTPNPCVQCNIKIKWESLLEKAEELGADYVATGHYARIKYNEETARYELMKGCDPGKDQSYALWGIKQANLAKTLFPLGELTKKQVREIARNKGLRTAEKAESMEICFVPDNDYHRFLKKAKPGLEKQTEDGQLVDMEGKTIGKHKGYPFFTIGQRRGIGTGFGKPMYVINTDPKSNKVVIGEKKDLLATGLIAKSVNLLSVSKIDEEMSVQIKIRYNDNGISGKLLNHRTDKIRVKFDSAKESVTPGQSVVFYDRDRVLGGGIIEKAIN